MKLISLNAGLFESNNDKLRQLLSDEKPDLIAFQEVTRRVDPAAKAEFISYDTIRESLSQLPYSFYAPTYVLTDFVKHDFHGHIDFRFDMGGRAEFGYLLQSAFPIENAQNIFVLGHFTYVTDWSGWPHDDQRSVQVTDLVVSGKQLRVLNYHGIWSKDKQGTEQTTAACQIIRTLALESEYSIICGDFNLFPDTESMRVFNQDFVSLVDTYDIKTTRPPSNELHQEKRNVVDYIFVSRNITVSSFEVRQSDVSDHLPLIAEFTLQ